MKITPQLLMDATRCTGSAAQIAVPMDAAATEFGITTPDQIAMFVAQTAYESARFTKFAEDMWYSHPETLMRVWPSRFPSAAFALQYTKSPTKLADYVYCNRMGNGNIASGDGSRFAGAGTLMITGRDMYEAYQKATGVPVLNNPQMVQRPADAARSGAWFWATHDFNALADAGDFRTLTIRLNGGLVGYDDDATHDGGLNDRLEYLAAARAAITAANQPSESP